MPTIKKKLKVTKLEEKEIAAQITRFIADLLETTLVHNVEQKVKYILNQDFDVRDELQIHHSIGFGTGDILAFLNRIRRTRSGAQGFKLNIKNLNE